jgi:DNA polymerase I-like protein with 3'-5' exonuclease and polymerase domains
MPSRDDELAPRIRAIFLPEEGTRWYAVDYSQQEFRLIVHVSETFARLSDSVLDKLRQEIIQHIAPGRRHISLRQLVQTAINTGDEYRRNPATDFHNWVAEITRLERRRAKDVNFAKAFGAGINQFSLMTGMTYDEAKSTMNTYDERLPFVAGAANIINWMAAQRGIIRLIDGACSHYPGFDGSFWYKNDLKDYARNHAMEAEQLYGSFAAATNPVDTEAEAQIRIDDPHHPWQRPIRHAFSHKAFNHLIQGSAARQMKKAMRDIGREGYLPMIQMHDELGFSFDNPDSARRCAQLMIEAVQLTIPMKVDIEYGPSWGEAKEKLE